VKFVKVETGIQDGAYVEITKGLKSARKSLPRRAPMSATATTSRRSVNSPRLPTKRRPDELFSLVHPKSHRAASGFCPAAFRRHSGLQQAADHPLPEYRRSARLDRRDTERRLPAELEIAGDEGDRRRRRQHHRHRRDPVDGHRRPVADRRHVPHGSADRTGRAGHQGRDRPHPRRPAGQRRRADRLQGRCRRPGDPDISPSPRPT
jgi:hypothetical protein